MLKVFLQQSINIILTVRKMIISYPIGKQGTTPTPTGRAYKSFPSYACA